MQIFNLGISLPRLLGARLGLPGIHHYLAYFIAHGDRAVNHCPGQIRGAFDHFL
jgi:hypothetical protein